MSCYGPLASWYDQLTGDVPYERFADFYEAELMRCDGEAHLLLDLCCGTATLSCALARRGYELIAVDSSEEMLMEGREKADELGVSPLFLCQDASELDLYGTVDGAFCSLDGMNYLPPEKLPEVFRRLHLFIRPGALFVFDVRSDRWLMSMDGGTYVDESDELLCLWRADYDEEINAVVYGMDLFALEGALWRRSSEEHVEYLYTFEHLTKLLEDAGFTDIHLLPDAPQEELGRLFISARRGS